MLIRFVVNNIYSFGEQKEFNMLPSPRFKRLKHHAYSINDFKVVKMSSLYGANGAGKSNLINALSLMQELVREKISSKRVDFDRFKFAKSGDETSQIFAIEFFQDEQPFYYALEIKEGLIRTEELYESGLGKKKDRLIFERKTDEQKKTSTHFLAEFENDTESKVLKSVIEKNLSKPDKPLLKLLTTLDNSFLNDCFKAFAWFDDTLQILSPYSKPGALAHKLDVDEGFRKYAREIMLAFHTGINNLRSETKTLEDFFGEEKSKTVLDSLKDVENFLAEHLFTVHSEDGGEIVIVKKGNELFVKQLKLEHTGKEGIRATFDLEEESDGTIRLLDFIPAFRDIVDKNRVYVIDEIERSIHPLLIKELIRKFSEDTFSKGQLIFSTHESNLLDQEILRQDEIWFVEKDRNGCTDLYSLSDFKEHNTIDIRKGYLTGRYGSIPFLANLKDLNWHGDDTKK